MTLATLILHDHSWTLSLVERNDAHLLNFTPEATPAQRAAELRKKLNELHCGDAALLLALPSAWCLSAHLPAAPGSRAFRLEEHLPLSAEEFVADYIPLADGASLAIAAELAPLQELISALDAAGIAVRHIVPFALLVPPGEGSTLIESADGSHDLLEYAEDRITRWSWFNAREQAGSTTAKTLPAESANTAALLAAARILKGSAHPPVDLRRDALAPPAALSAFRPAMGLLAASLFLFCTCLSIAALWRGHRYQQQADADQRAQVTLFKQLMPDQRAPSSVKSWLLSEHNTLAAMRGRTGDAQVTDLLSRPSALTQLRDVLKGLPSELPFQLLEIDLQPTTLRLEGQAATHAAADQLAAAIRQTGAFEVNAPRTQALRDGTVSFSFSAKPRTASPLAAKGDTP